MVGRGSRGSEKTDSTGGRAEGKGGQPCGCALRTRASPAPLRAVAPAIGTLYSAFRCGRTSTRTARTVGAMPAHSVTLPTTATTAA